ncbi:MAG: RNA-binding protein [Peptococcaceae bacterium]
MLFKYTAEAKEFLAKVTDKAEIVTLKHMEQVTDFVDPYLTNCALQYLKGTAGINFFAFGGTDNAERKRIIICPEYLNPDPVMAKVDILEFTGTVKYNKYSHRDYLGAIMGQGIKREKIGDIYPLVNGFAVITTREIKEFFLIQELKIKGVSFSPKVHEIGEWKPPQAETQSRNITVSSLRLDTITAHGFGLSRTGAAEYIKSGKVKVNWQVMESIVYQCQKGDTISLRGQGRISVYDIGGETKKGRLKLTILKYI